MNRKYALLIVLSSFFVSASYAQVIIGGGSGFGGRFGRIGFTGGGGMRRQRNENKDKNKESTFKPEISVKIGYGFPNVDTYQFSDYVGLYKGSISQTGPITSSVDYKYNSTNSIGIMATYGKVAIPYTDGNNNYEGKVNLETRSVLANFMQFRPLTNSATFYFHEALGASINNVNYLGNVPVITPASFAYQLGVGAKFKISEKTSFFAEAGYGKYVLHGGLSYCIK